MIQFLDPASQTPLLLPAAPRLPSPKLAPGRANMLPLPSPSASSAPAAAYTPVATGNQEAADNADLTHYAAGAFNRWYGNLLPNDAAKFRGNPSAVGTLRMTTADGVVHDASGPRDADNLEGIQRDNARQYFTSNLLPRDAGYQALAQTAKNARNARIAGIPTQAYAQSEDANGRLNAQSAADVGRVNAGAAQTQGQTERTRQLLPAEVNAANIANRSSAAMIPLHEGEVKAQTNAINSGIDDFKVREADYQKQIQRLQAENDRVNALVQRYQNGAGARPASTANPAADRQIKIAEAKARVAADVNLDPDIKQQILHSLDQINPSAATTGQPESATFGRTARNANGERMGWDGTKWVPIP